MKIKAKTTYIDKELDRKVINAGTIYEVKNARGEYLIDRGFAELVKEEGKKDGKRESIQHSK